MDRTQRTPEEVMRAAQEALAAENFSEPWGADADHLKTEADVERTADAGFCFFTIDPSAYVANEADRMSEAHLSASVNGMVNDKIFPNANWTSFYLDKKFPLASGELVFSRETLFRAAVKYGRAVAHCERIALAIIRETGEEDAKGQPLNTGSYEIEISVDETDSPTSILEHLFFALE